jgi:hypothetical protein
MTDVRIILFISYIRPATLFPNRCIFLAIAEEFFSSAHHAHWPAGVKRSSHGARVHDARLLRLQTFGLSLLPQVVDAVNGGSAGSSSPSSYIIFACKFYVGFSEESAVVSQS